MKNLTFLFLGLILAATGFAQTSWQSKNSKFIDDLPFDEDGNLVFSEVIDYQGVSPADAYAIIKFGFLPAVRPEKAPESLSNESTVRLFSFIPGVLGNCHYVYATITDRVDIREARIRCSMIVTELAEKVLGEPLQRHPLSYYLSKENFVKLSFAKELHAALLTQYSRRVSALKMMDFAGIAIKDKTPALEKRDKNWKSQIDGYPEDLPFREFLDFDHVGYHDGPSLLYSGIIKTPDSPAKQAAALRQLFPSISEERDYGVFRFNRDAKGPSAGGSYFTAEGASYIKYLFETRKEGCRYFIHIYDMDDTIETKAFGLFLGGSPAEYLSGQSTKIKEKAIGEWNILAGKLVAAMSGKLGQTKDDDW